jgi:ABC-type branched-subunit amino acid transport system ATPase component
MSEPVLRVEAVTAGYGGAPVIKGVTLQAQAGQITAIVGPNGAGKSTLLKALMGLVRTESGRVWVGDADVTGLPTEKLVSRGLLSYVPQVANVFPGLTVRENLAMGGYCRRAGLDERTGRMYELFPALRDAANRRAGTLSGGERTMLAMARGLMLDPVVLLLDEPSAGLSPAYQSTLWEQIGAVARTGVAVCVVEQNTRRTLTHAQWAYVLVLGANALDGPAQALLHDQQVVNLYIGRLSQ